MSLDWMCAPLSTSLLFRRTNLPIQEYGNPFFCAVDGQPPTQYQPPRKKKKKADFDHNNKIQQQTKIRIKKIWMPMDEMEGTYMFFAQSRPRNTRSIILHPRFNV
ncbi:unnamed protein product [Mortierella alpina]